MRMPPTDTVSPLSADHGHMRARVSLTPLIDVVFILLVFFMLASSFLDWRAFDLSVAGPGTSSEAPEQEPMRIVVQTGGTLLLNGEAVTPDRLQAQVEAAVASDPTQRLYVEPRAGVPLQAAIDVLDRVSAVGAEHVSLVRESGAQ